jgi:hypothetical protein
MSQKLHNLLTGFIVLSGAVQFVQPLVSAHVFAIVVAALELRRIRDELDEQLASGLALYRRVENLIKQGTVIKKGDSSPPIQVEEKG